MSWRDVVSGVSLFVLGALVVLDIMNTRESTEAVAKDVNVHVILHVEQEQGEGEAPLPPLAVQNNNPCNVKPYRADDPWLGQVGVDKHGHVVFSSLEYGIRAAALTLCTYSKKYGIDTVKGVLDRFTAGEAYATYIKYVCDKLGVAPDEKIDIVKRMPDLLRAMAYFESGVEFDEKLFIPYDILTKLSKEN